MTIVLFNLNWGYQVYWREANTVLDIVEDPTSPGPRRSPEATTKAQNKLTQYQKSNLFASTVKESEKATLLAAIENTTPGWQFYRKDKYLYAWKDCWSSVQVGGKAPDPLKMKSARGLADQIQLYETGRKLVKRREYGVGSME